MIHDVDKPEVLSLYDHVEHEMHLAAHIEGLMSIPLHWTSFREVEPFRGAGDNDDLFTIQYSHYPRESPLRCTLRSREVRGRVPQKGVHIEVQGGARKVLTGPHGGAQRGPWKVYIGVQGWSGRW